MDTEFQRQLRYLGACTEARKWAAGRTLTEAWAECERPDWMLWLATERLPRERVVLAACACARAALNFVPAGEDRPRIAIETAERWTRGEATIDEVRKARSDASAAAAAAYASAAYAYAAAAAAAGAAAADADAAYASAAYAAAAADADAGSKAKSGMCDLIRGLIRADELAP